MPGGLEEGLGEERCGQRNGNFREGWREWKRDGGRQHEKRAIRKMWNQRNRKGEKK